MPSSYQIIREILPEIHTMEKCDFLKSIICKLTEQLWSCCIAFWGNVYPFTMPGLPGELIAREKINFQ